MTLPAQAQNDTEKTALEQKLKGQFALTTVTADRRDIVTPGTVLVLHKEGLLMYAIFSPMPPMNTYKNGKVTQGWSGFGRDMAISMRTPGNPPAEVYPRRKFVEGEKVWITGYSVAKDGVLLQLYSDPYGELRFYGQLKILYPKGSVPPADEVLRTISEVVTADAPVPETPAATMMAPIPPPPPPADVPPASPQTIALGQSKEEVVAMLGQPQKVASLGPKEIYYYPDMKIIFLNGKVKDIQ
jgi:hypothetical protein